MSKFFFILGTLLASLFFGVTAQPLWTVDNCIDYAIKHNLNLEKSKLQNEINHENYNQSIRNLLPSVGLNAGSGIYFGKSVDPTTYDFINKQFFSTSYSLGASMGLFSGFSRLNTVSFNKLNYLAGIEDNKHQKNEVAFEVVSQFFNVLFYEGLLEIAKKQKESSELNVKRARVNFNTGLSAKSDLLEMESRMAVEELYVVQTQNYLNAALLNLKQAMNYAGNKIFVLDDNIVSGDTGSFSETEADTVYNQALVLNPQIKAVELRKSAAEKNLSVSKGRLLPNLNMSGGYSTNYAKTSGDETTVSLSEQFKRNASQSVSLSLQVPIFYNWGRQSEVKKAKLEVLQAQADFDLTKQQLFQEIEKNFNDLSALSAEYTQTVKQWEASKIAFQSAEKKLEQGLIDAIAFYDSKNLMAKAESDVLRTKLQFELKKRTIDFFIGKPIYSE